MNSGKVSQLWGNIWLNNRQKNVVSASQDVVRPSGDELDSSSINDVLTEKCESPKHLTSNFFYLSNVNHLN